MYQWANMRKSALEIGIIGLGKFGLTLGELLTRLGSVCIGLDNTAAKVQQARAALTQVYEGDATDRNVLAQIKMHSMDVVVLAMGDKLEKAILAILNLQELGAKCLIVKAASPVHKKVFDKMGVQGIVQPEIEAARQLAYRLDNPGLIDLLPIGRGVALQESTVDNWAGKSLRELNLRHASNVLVAAVRPNGSQDYHFVPDPARKLQKGDSLLIIGYADGVNSVLDRT